MALRKPSRWLSVAALVIALIGLGVGIVGWFRPVSPDVHPAAPTTPGFTGQQITEAKSNICTAYKLAKNEVADNTHRSNPAEGGEVSQLAVAANARLAIYAAGDYLLTRLAAEPATPSDLADLVRSLGNSYQEAGMRALNNASDSELDPFRRDIDANISKIDGLCK
ncbi:hypothetical protein [Mycobacterium xenopi]|nr:hypothetical protein [Mycobacterium xenopi]EUA42891.1 hypothetical protein I552_7632 [Mycobacterium xenopi 3993]MDA3642265.1 hypothetical protein [Mycobacterium xenopi]MDA3660349.1 hypothetical protein [Mycobacterium xenopi]MDA3664924.1 hypothetical protein [Mycobacterium xenopi]